MTYFSEWIQGKLGYPSSITHNPQGILTGHNWNSTYQSICIFFSLSLSIIPTGQLKSPSIILFSFPLFLFSISFCCPSKKNPKTILPWCYSMKGYKHRELPRELPWRTQISLVDHCQPQWYLQGSDEVGEAIFWCGHLQERKRWGPTNYFLYPVFDHDLYEFHLRY